MKRILTGFVGGLAAVTAAAVMSLSAQSAYAQYPASPYQNTQAGAYYGSVPYDCCEETIQPFFFYGHRFAAPAFGLRRGPFARGYQYQGIDPEAGNPYAGYTVTRGPRDFLMKNPPNIGP